MLNDMASRGVGGAVSEEFPSAVTGQQLVEVIVTASQQIRAPTKVWGLLAPMASNH